VEKMVEVVEKVEKVEKVEVVEKAWIWACRCTGGRWCRSEGRLCPQSCSRQCLH